MLWPLSAGRVSSKQCFMSWAQRMFYCEYILQLYVNAGQFSWRKYRLWYRCLIQISRNMKLNQKDAMQTEVKESIRQCKITFHTKKKEFYFTCSHPPTHISLTCRHPQYKTTHVSHFGRHNNPHFLYFLAVGLLWNTVALFFSSPFADCFTLQIFVCSTPPCYLMALLCIVSQRIIITVGWHKVARCSRHRRSLSSLLL